VLSLLMAYGLAARGNKSPFNRRSVTIQTAAL